MVKTGQFTTKCKGDRVVALKRQISLWQDSIIVKHALTSEVMWRIVTQCKCCCNKETNGYFSSSNRAFKISHPPIFGMTSLVRACLTIYIKSNQSDICCFRAVTLSPLQLVVNWPVFTARRIASAVLATAIPSVCPSVRHTPVLCQNDGT